jgi:poly(hydroxyalkanoate) depolymerase family esterase
MNLIDWQELYAANRAVIEGRRAPGDDDGWPVARPARSGPGHALPAVPPAALPAPHVSPPVPDERSGGRWERLSHEGDGRSRHVFLYTPPGLDEAVAAPAVVMLHGCTQGAASFATGTAMNAEADRRGFVVVYPEQSRDANQQGCWNWFQSEQQRRDGAEPSFIAGATRAAIECRAIDPARVYVAGLSAGGAMASIMAATHPDLFAAVAVHSGLAYGSARTLPAAVAAMRSGAGDPEAMGRAAHAAMGRAARPVPSLVIHGRADQVVCPVNGEEVARQWLAANRLAANGSFDGDFRRPTETSSERGAHGRTVTARRWADRDGRVLQELVEIDGLGHAWSGGTPRGSHTDPRGPSATAAIWEFFSRAGAAAAR